MQKTQSEQFVSANGDEFHAGLWTARPPDELPPGAAAVCKNADFSRAKGRIPKRRGQATDHASNGAGSCNGFFRFLLSTGAKFDIVAAGSFIFKVVGAVWTSLYTMLVSGTDVNFTQFSDLCISVSATEPTEKWDGVAAGFAVLLGTPPANGKFIIIWQNRVWIANTSAGKSRLHYSNVGLPEDWTTAGAAGFIDIDINDGDEITGILPVGTALYIFKNRRVFKLVGVTATTFNAQPIILNRGCVAPRSIVSMGPFIIYLSQYGLHSVGDYVDGFMTEAIEYDIIGLTKTKVCAGKFRDNYILAFDSNADGINDSAYVLDLRTGAWTLWDNMNANVFLTKEDGNLYSAGSDLQITRQHDTGEDDSGTPITMTWRSGMFDFGDWTGIKRLLDQWFKGKPLAGKHLTVNIYADGLLKTTDSVALDPAFSNETIKVFGQDCGDALDARYYQIEFVNAELAAPVEIMGLSLAAKVAPRQQADA